MLSLPPVTMTPRGTWLRPVSFLEWDGFTSSGLRLKLRIVLSTFPPKIRAFLSQQFPTYPENELSHISFETEPERVERYRERLKTFYRHCVECMPPGLPKILMGHLFVHGGQVSDSERNIQIGGATAMQISDFPDDVTYVALGHLHRPHAISGANYPVQYAGSPLPLRFNEANYSKKVYLLDVPASGDAQVKEIEIPVFKGLRTVTGKPRRGTLNSIVIRMGRAIYSGTAET